MPTPPPSHPCATHSRRLLHAVLAAPSRTRHPSTPPPTQAKTNLPNTTDSFYSQQIYPTTPTPRPLYPLRCSAKNPYADISYFQPTCPNPTIPTPVSSMLLPLAQAIHIHQHNRRFFLFQPIHPKPPTPATPSPRYPNARAHYLSTQHTDNFLFPTYSPRYHPRALLSSSPPPKSPTQAKLTPAPPIIFIFNLFTPIPPPRPSLLHPPADKTYPPPHLSPPPHRPTKNPYADKTTTHPT